MSRTSCPALTSPTKKTAVIYCRVSTGRQKDQDTIAAQLTKSKQIAEHFDLQIIDVIEDPARSGTLLEGRNFSTFIDSLRNNTWKTIPDYLIVYSLSRICRVENANKNPEKVIKSNQDAATIKSTLLIKNIKIIDEDGIVDPNTIQYDIKTLLANEEYKLIRSRTVSGKTRKFELGLFARGGKAPYGYRFISAEKDGKKIGYHLEIDPITSVNLLQIFEWVIAYGYTYASKMANEYGFQTPYGKSDETPKWQAKTIQDFVRNSARYRGEITVRNRGEIYTLSAPPIIDAQLHTLLTREKTLANKLQGQNGKRKQYLTTGYLACENCGGYLVNKAEGQAKIAYLRCETCKITLMRSEIADYWLWVLACYRIIATKTASIVNFQSIDYSAEMKSIEDQLGKVKARIKRVMDLLIDSEFDSQNAELKKRLNDLIFEKNGLDEQAKELKKKQNMKANAINDNKHLAAIFEGIDTNEELPLNIRRNIFAQIMGGNKRLIVRYNRDEYRAFSRMSERPPFSVILPPIGLLGELVGEVKADYDYMFGCVLLADYVDEGSMTYTRVQWRLERLLSAHFLAPWPYTKGNEAGAKSKHFVLDIGDN